MKKFVKPLVIASSVAAIAGIGAVSFAAWTAGTDGTKNVENNSLGAVSVLKFGETVTSAVTGLLPIDQGGTHNADSNKLYGELKFSIVASDAYGYSDFKLEVKVDKGDIATGTKFYVGTSAPTAESKGTEVDASAGATLTINISAGDYTIYICHDSSNLDDMNETFKVTLTLKDGATVKGG